MKKRVGLVTCAAYAALPEDDQLLAAALGGLGIEAVSVVWSAPGAADPACDALVVRATWDYVERLDEFLRWLDGVGASGVPLWNDAETVRWNLDKRYLRELAAAGTAIVPTEFVERGEDARGPALARGWDEVVLKPAVSLGAWRTVRASAAAAGVAERALLVQPFLQEITSAGELSFVFFDGALSHVVRKTPRPGDFRVQEVHGGSSALLPAPDPALAAQAAAALRASGRSPLYARVDGIARDGQLLLMELELIEPSLFFGLAPGAAALLARAIARRLGSG